MTTSTPTEKIDNLLKSDASTFLRSIRTDMANLLDSTDESLRQKLGEVYAAAIVLSHDKDQWQTFCEQEEWISFRQRPKPIDAHRENALRYAVRYAVGFDGTSSNQAAYRYKKALEGCWSGKVAPSEVPDLIKASGGIEKLKQQNVQHANHLPMFFTPNRFTEIIAEQAAIGFDAILLVRFEERGAAEVHGTILAGVARKDGYTSLEQFTVAFKKWRAAQEKLPPAE